MFKEFVDEHNDKAVRKANQFVEEKGVEVKSFVAFADNLTKVHLIVEFEEAPATKKVTTKATTKKPVAKSTAAK